MHIYKCKSITELAVINTLSEINKKKLSFYFDYYANIYQFIILSNFDFTLLILRWIILLISKQDVPLDLEKTILTQVNAQKEEHVLSFNNIMTIFRQILKGDTD